MTVRARLDTKGFAEYLEDLAKAGRAIDEITAEALEAGGQVILDGMIRRVPVDTGNLRSSLSIDGPHRVGNYTYVQVGLNRGTDADTARYGGVQEYGAADTPAQSYIRPALAEDMRKARVVMREVFERHLDGVK